METPNSGRWSELSNDILISLFERLSFVDFHRSKIVCKNWYLCSKQTLHRKSGSPWLMLLPEDDCVLYNPDEDKVYKTKRDLSGIRFLASSGKWFLVLDSESNLYIMDMFSEKRINLPPLDSIKGGIFSLKLAGNKKLNYRLTSGSSVLTPNGFIQSVDDLRALLWVDEKKEEYTVVWFIDSSAVYIAFCKNGEDYYRTIPTTIGVRREIQGISDMVLRGDMLYVYTTRQYIRRLDLSGQEGYKEVCKSDILSSESASYHSLDYGIPYDLSNVLLFRYNIAVTTSGEVLMVESILFKAISKIPKIFYIFKKNPNLTPDDIYYEENLFVEVESLGDEALLLDLGITVPADHNLGIEPNSIYFTRHDRVRNYTKKPSCHDICVFNLATKTLKRFPSLSNLKLKDARWFLPS